LMVTEAAASPRMQAPASAPAVAAPTRCRMSTKLPALKTAPVGGGDGQEDAFCAPTARETARSRFQYTFTQRTSESLQDEIDADNQRSRMVEKAPSTRRMSCTGAPTSSRPLVSLWPPVDLDIEAKPPLTSSAAAKPPLSARGEAEPPLSARAAAKPPLSARAAAKPPLSSRGGEEPPLSAGAAAKPPLSPRHAASSATTEVNAPEVATTQHL